MNAFKGIHTVRIRLIKESSADKPLIAIADVTE